MAKATKSQNPFVRKPPVGGWKRTPGSYLPDPRSVMERFSDSYIPEPNSGCWLWDHASHNQHGHGKMWIKRRGISAHRLSWELHRGAIPAGIQVCHKCDTPACVNPDHLFLGDQKDNQEDMVRKGRSAKGERQHLAKMTADGVIEVRRLYAEGLSKAHISRVFDVSESCIRFIIYGVTWRHV